MSWAAPAARPYGRELPRRPGPYRLLVLGGARSGKSVTAERLLAGRDQVDYVATGAPADPADPEWAARVRLHQQRRPAHWVTLETRDLESVLAAPGLTARQLATPVLVDCLSTWLAGVMDECGLWSARSGGRPGAGRSGGRAAGCVAGHPPDRRGGQQRGRLGGDPRYRVRGALPRRARPAQHQGRRGVPAGLAVHGRDPPAAEMTGEQDHPGTGAPPRTPAWRVALSLFTVIPAGVGRDLDEGAAARAVFWLPVLGAGLGLAGAGAMVLVAAGGGDAGAAAARRGPGHDAARAC